MPKKNIAISLNFCPVELILADSFLKRALGLFYSGRLKNRQGLWIRPCNSIHTFFMSREIDVIFLNKEGQVKKTQHAVKPYSFVSCKGAHSVIEMESGSLAEIGLALGDKIQFP